MTSNINTNDEDCIFITKTIQIAPIRTLMAALKDIILEGNMTFQKDGIRIINMDKSHTVLVHMHLNAENFEYYNCKKDKIIVGVNMLHLFKIINAIDNDETLSIYIEDKDYNDGIVEYLTIKFENKNIKQCKIYKLKLIEPEQEELTVPNVTFSTIINMPSSDFQKIIRDMNNISEKLEIKSVDNQLIFKCDGPFANAELIRAESDGMGFIQKNSSIIQGEFSLKNLNYFIKCTNLCNQIELYLANDIPLIVKYNVASLGAIKLGLSPIPSNNN